MNRIIIPLLFLSCLACRKNKTDTIEPLLTGNTFLVSAGGKSHDFVEDLFVNSEGGCWITGSSAFEPLHDTSIYFGNNLFKGVAGDDIAIARYDKHGNVMWARVIGSSLWDAGKVIAADNNNNCYVAGVFTDKLKFDDVELTAQDSRNTSGIPNMNDMFFVKYDGQGKVVWVKHVRGVGSERPTSMVLDRADNILITGYYQNKIQFEETLNANVTSFERPGPAFFIAKYTPGGSLLWVKSIGSKSYGSLYPTDMKLDQNENIVITGAFQGPQDFGSINVVGTVDQDVFTAKFDNTGNILWAIPFGGTGPKSGNTLALDESGNVYVGGMFKNNMTAGNLSITSTNNSSDAFFAKLDMNGSVQWLISAQGDEEECVRDMIVYKDSLYSLGYFSKNFTLAQYVVPNPVGWNGFMTRHSLDGQLGGFMHFPLNSGTPTKMAIDASGYSFIGGYFSEGIKYENQYRVSRGGYDMFLWKRELTLY